MNGQTNVETVTGSPVETNASASTVSTETVKVKKTPGRKASPDTMVSFWAINGARVTQKGKPSIDMLKNRRRVTMAKVELANYDPKVHGYGEVDPADALEITRRETPKVKKAKAVAPVGATMPAPAPATATESVAVTA